MRIITIAALAALSLNSYAVEYTPDTDVDYDIIHMHDTTTWAKVCESFDGVCDVPEGTYQVKLLDRNWNELDLLRDVIVRDDVVVTAPANLWADVYSASAIELFWDRADTLGLVYQVSRNGTPIGESSGISFFVDGLVDTSGYDFSVQAVDGAGNVSTVSSIYVTTAGLNDPVDNPFDDSRVLKDVRLDIYSDNAAELLWDRPSVSEGVVSIDVMRSGKLIGTSFGTSYFDDTRTPNTNQTYRLVAIDSEGNRSIAADIGQFEVQKLDTGAGEAAFGNYGHVAVSGDTAIVPADREIIDGYTRTGAVYVFTRDSADKWHQTQKLTAAADGDGGFGLSVAIDGNTLAIGQRFIPESDEFLDSRGGVTVYSRDVSGQWGDARKLVVEADDKIYRFGNAIAIDGNTMMVGANNNSGTSPVFVFERDNSHRWLQTQVLSLEYEDSQLGTAIQIEGNTAILGDYRDPTHGFLSGAAWIYNRSSSGTWSRGARLLPSAGGKKNYLGTSVGLAGDTAVIGGEQSTRAYVFSRRDDGQWVETQVLDFDIPEQLDYNYWGTGLFVDIDDDTLVVGARDASRLGYITGAVQVFHKFGNRWYETAVLGSSDGKRNLAFGEAVAIDGNTIVTGALIPPSDYNPIGTTAYIHVLD